MRTHTDPDICLVDKQGRFHESGFAKAWAKRIPCLLRYDVDEQNAQRIAQKYDLPTTDGSLCGIR